LQHRFPQGVPARYTVAWLSKRFFKVIEKEKKSKQVVRNYLCDATSQMEWLGYEIIHV